MKNTTINNLLLCYMLSKNKYRNFKEIPKITQIKLKALIKDKKVNFITYLTGVLYLLFGTMPVLKKKNKEIEIYFKFFKNFDNLFLPLFFLLISKKNEISFSNFEGTISIFNFKIKNLLNFYPTYNLYFNAIQMMHSFIIKVLFNSNINNSKESYMVAVSLLNLNQIYFNAKN